MLEVWGEEAGYLVLWFLEEAPLTGEPFQLDQAQRVTDPSLFFYALYLDVHAGPAGPRARTGALQQELRLLYALLEGEASGAECDSPSETRKRYERAKRA